MLNKSVFPGEKPNCASIPELEKFSYFLSSAPFLRLKPSKASKIKREIIKTYKIQIFV